MTNPTSPEPTGTGWEYTVQESITRTDFVVLVARRSGCSEAWGTNPFPRSDLPRVIAALQAQLPKEESADV